MATSGKCIALQNALFTRCYCVGRTDFWSFLSMNDCLHLVVACSEQAQRMTGIRPTCMLPSNLHNKRCIKLGFLSGIPALVHQETDLAFFAITYPALRFMAMPADPCVDVMAFDIVPKIAGEAVIQCPLLVAAGGPPWSDQFAHG